MSRVSCTERDNSIILVAPHGVMGDDDYTDLITEEMAKDLDCSCLINSGWRRSDKIDLTNYKANLNNVSHCAKVPEFFNEFKSLIDLTLKSYKSVNLFFIHGMGDWVKKLAKSRIDIIIGYGEGLQPSYTCPIWYKNEFGYRLEEMNLGVFQGRAGGKFSARSQTNLCQYYRLHKPNIRVNSIQIEIINRMRSDKNTSKRTAKVLAVAISNFIYKDVKVPFGFSLAEI